MNADSIFQKFRQERDSLLALLDSPDPSQVVDKLWSSQSPLPIDRGCMWRPGSPGAFSQVPRGIRKSHACSQCRHLDFLLDLSNDNVDVPFVIEAGSLAGKELIIEVKNTPNASVKLISGSRLESDPFTQNILASWLLPSKLGETDAIPTLYTGFICGTRGYLVTEATLPVDEVTMTPEIVRGLTYQLISVLKRLESLRFLHGNPQQDSLKVILEPIAYLQDNKKITSPISLKLSGLGGSSFDWRNLRLIPRHPLNSRYVEAITSFPTTNPVKLSSSDLSTIRHLHETGIPIMPFIEIYLFIGCLLLEESFGRIFIQDDDLVKILETMFQPEDFHNLYEDLESTWQHKNMDGWDLLAGKQLNRNVLSELTRALFL